VYHSNHFVCELRKNFSQFGETQSTAVQSESLERSNAKLPDVGNFNNVDVKLSIARGS